MPYKDLEERRRYQRRYQKDNPDKVRLIAKTWRDNNKKHRGMRRRLEQYGVTEEQFALLWAVHKGRCAICSIKLIKVLGRRGLANGACLDHNHTNGRIRGLLCMRCNKGLGCFKDSVQALKAAAAYLISDGKNIPAFPESRSGSILWKRARHGLVESRDGRWVISRIRECTPQKRQLYELRRNSEIVKSNCHTQHEAKVLASKTSRRASRSR